MQLDTPQTEKQSKPLTQDETPSSTGDSLKITRTRRQTLSDITIIPVQSKREKKEFVDFPWSIYSKLNDSNWVPPLKLSVYEMLDTKKNPFYKRAEIQLFLAKQNGKTVGRIAAIENQAHNEHHNEKAGHYGFFECIDDQDVANVLFNSAENWLRARGLTKMLGPMNPSTNHECGLLVRGQRQHQTIQTTWNPKYYQTLHEKAGLQKAKDLVAYWLPTGMIDQLPERVTKVADRCRKSERITFRSLDLKNFDREIDLCFEIYNSAWEKNWGFFPMTQEEFKFAAKEMKMIIDTRFAFIAEQDGKAAGFMLAVPDINHILKRIPNGKLLPTGIFKLLLGKRLLKTVRIIALGVKPEFRNKGIFALFNHESWLRAKASGTIGGEASWILEDNEAMNRPWLDMGAPLYRRWRIYESHL